MHFIELTNVDTHHHPCSSKFILLAGGSHKSSCYHMKIALFGKPSYKVPSSYCY